MHTWASLSVMAGMPLMVVARNLGHADTRMVEKHYCHLTPSYVADAIRPARATIRIRLRQQRDGSAQGLSNSAAMVWRVAKASVAMRAAEGLPLTAKTGVRVRVLFGWLAHFSPFTDQTPQYICSAYKTPVIGWLALLWLVALMISLIVAGLYAEYLWARQPKRR